MVFRTAVLSLLFLLLPPVVTAADGPMDYPSAAEVEEQSQIGEKLTGRELYDRLLKNRKRLKSSYQESYATSSDEAGNPQRVNFWTQALDYRDEEDEATDDVFSRTIVKFTGPYELRHTGYMFVHHDQAEDEQFIFSPTRGRTHRVSMKGQHIAGTDFSFEDFLVSVGDIEDADYTRRADEEVKGMSCYVVEAVMRPEAGSSYTRTKNWLEKEHYVPVKTEYWDEADVLAKRMEARHDSISEFGGTWIATDSTMHDLLEDTHSRLVVDLLEPEPGLTDSDFALSNLQQRP